MTDPRPSGTDATSRTARTSRRTQTERRAESDQRILNAAMKLIARNGAARSSLADIGVAAGYSRGLPSERFGTKVELLKALVDSMDAWFAVRVQVALKGKRGLDAVLARAAVHLDGAIRSPVATMALHGLYVESLSVIPELRPHMATLSEGYRQAFIAHLREGQRLGEIRRDINCSHQASIILGALRGLTHQAFINDATTNLKAAKPALLDTLRQALRVR
jgi:AcrR family transcriptional regulator